MSRKRIVCHDVHGKKTEVDANQLRFRPSVYGILIEEGRVLLSKEWDGYDFPGGGANIDETMEDALIREFLEETGLKVRLTDLVYCGTRFFHPSHSEKHKNEYWNCPVIYFLVKKVGGKISLDNCSEEERDYKGLPKWIALENIEDLKFYNSVDSVKIIKKALKQLK